MAQIALIGLGAGAASALLFASVASGSLLSIFLFYVAPLPILIAALGWSHWAAALAAIGGATTLAAVFGSVFFLAFLAGTGVPAWWLGYLAMLARPATASGNGALEWYPPGRLVLWCAGFATLVVGIGVLNLGTDFDGFRSELRRGLEQIIQFKPDPSDAAAKSAQAALIDFLVVVIPPAGAVLATITNALNLWLAGRIVKFSDRLRRPWPDLSAMTFPKATLAALAAIVVLAFAGGLVGILATVAAASLLIAYGIIGFAVLHALTRGVKGRPMMLGAAYGSVMILGWPILGLSALGVADAIFGLRLRTARRRGPPAS